MKRVICQGEVKALTNVIQTVGKNKNASLCRKSPIVTYNDEGNAIIVQIPTLSGNSPRHMLRTLMAALILEHLQGTTFDYNTLTLLTSGGAGVTKEAGQVVARLRNVEECKKTNVPFSVFGGSVNGIIAKGKAAIHDMIPVCIETIKAGLVPSKYSPEVYKNIWAKNLVREIQYVRVDIAKDANVLDYLDEEGIGTMIAADAEAAKASAKRKANRKAKEDGVETPESEDDGSVDMSAQSRQMIYTYEGIAAGTTFYHRMVFSDLTDVELGGVVAALRKFADYPYLAGLSSKGNGQVALDYKVSVIDDGKRDDNYGSVKIDADMDFSLSGHLEARLADFDKYLSGLTVEDISVKNL